MLSLLLLGVLVAGAAAQCSTDQRLVNHFGYQKSSNQGTNNNFFYLSGLFSVSASGSNILQCGAPTTNGIVLTEAFYWALNNRLPGILPSVSLGGVVLDSCDSGELLGVQVATLETCQARVGDVTPKMWVPDSSVIGYVGLNSPKFADQTLKLLNAKEKAAVTFGLHSVAYDAFPYMKSLSYSDRTRAQAMIELMKKQTWKYIQIVFHDNARFQPFLAFLKTELTKTDICVVQQFEYKKVAVDAVAAMLTFKTVRPVLLLLEDEDMMAVIRASNSNPGTGVFTWLLTSESAPIFPADIKEAAAGALLFVDEPAYSRLQQFRTYFKTLQPSASLRVKNPWFDAWFSTKHRCNVPGVSGSFATLCTSAHNLNSMADSEISSSAAYVLQAVDLFTAGLHEAIQSTCTGGIAGGVCSSFLAHSAKSSLVLQKMKQPNIGSSTILQEMNNYRMNVINYRKKGGSCSADCYVTVSHYSKVGTSDPVLTKTESLYSYGPPPLSSLIRDGVAGCGPNCPSFCPVKGAVVATTTPPPEVSSTSSPVPVKSPLRFRQAYWVYALIVCAGVGLLLVLFLEAYILIKTTGSKSLRRLRTWWLGQFLLLAIFLGYLLLFAWVPWPNRHMCGLIRFGVGGIYSMAFSVILVKLMVLQNSKKLGYLEGVYQFLMFVFAWAVQLVINAEWLILRRPDATFSEPLNRWICNHSYDDHVLSLVYCMLLLAMCTILAIRTHGIITNNREGIFIGIACGFSIPVWLGWTLVGGLNATYEIKETVVPFGLFINLTIILLIMFIPKVRQINTLGVEAIYAEDVKGGDEVVTQQPRMYSPSVAPSCKSGSVIMSPNFTTLQPVHFPNDVTLVPAQNFDEVDASGLPMGNPHSLFLKHPGSVAAPRSVVGLEPVYNNGAARPQVTRLSNDLTGRFPRQYAGSEAGYNPSYRNNVLSVQNMGGPRSTHSMKSGSKLGRLGSL